MRYRLSLHIIGILTAVFSAALLAATPREFWRPAESTFDFHDTESSQTPAPKNID